MGCAVIRQEQMHGLREGHGLDLDEEVYRVSGSLSDAVGGGLIPTHPSAFARGYGGTSEVVLDDSANNTYDQ